MRPKKLKQKGKEFSTQLNPGLLHDYDFLAEDIDTSSKVLEHSQPLRFAPLSLSCIFGTSILSFFEFKAIIPTVTLLNYWCGMVTIWAHKLRSFIFYFFDEDKLRSFCASGMSSSWG